MMASYECPMDYRKENQDDGFAARMATVSAIDDTKTVLEEARHMIALGRAAPSNHLFERIRDESLGLPATLRKPFCDLVDAVQHLVEDVNRPS